MLHLETVTPNLLTIIRTISNEPSFSEFRLVGGTALSLMLGHRISIDADFFTDTKFEINLATEKLSSILPGFQILNKSANGLTGVYKGVKIDLYTWGMNFLSPASENEGMRIASLEDVAALKMEAVINRKEEKDFRDMHALLQKFPLSELIDFFRKRYPQYSPRMLTDNLLAASHVERDNSIRLINEVDWEKITTELVEHVNLFYTQAVKRREKQAEENIKKRIQEIQKKGKKDR